MCVFKRLENAYSHCRLVLSDSSQCTTCLTDKTLIFDIRDLMFPGVIQGGNSSSVVNLWAVYNCSLLTMLFLLPLLTFLQPLRCKTVHRFPYLFFKTSDRQEFPVKFGFQEFLQQFMFVHAIRRCVHLPFDYASRSFCHQWNDGSYY